MKPKHFSLQNRIKSFGYALNGLQILIKEEHNAKIHLAAAILAVIFGFVYSISLYEWIAVTFSIGLVFCLEIVNTAIENVADFISPEQNDKIKKIKDLAASGVLVSALSALIIGLCIFVPKIFGF